MQPADLYPVQQNQYEVGDKSQQTQLSSLVPVPFTTFIHVCLSCLKGVQGDEDWLEIGVEEGVAMSGARLETGERVMFLLESY